MTQPKHFSRHWVVKLKNPSKIPSFIKLIEAGDNKQDS